MTNEVATTLTATQPSFSLAPRDINEALKFADMMSKSNLVPKDFVGNPGNILVAIQWGMELGLQPMQAMQNIAVINGRPSLWGDSVIALVKSSPSCEYVVEEATDDKATCRVKRRGEPEQVRVFTKEDAKTAGLIGKQGPWTQYPKRMMQMRARSWALRDVFPDVLRGMPIAEEVMDISEKEINPMPPRQTGTQAGEAARTAPIVDSAERNELIASLEETAREIGIEAYADKWKNLSAAQRKMVGTDEHERLKKLAMTPSSELKTSEVIDAETGGIGHD